ncbi:hypothetical protein JOB18_031168 [Solea senegalensis]|uniref:Uncharacterized protein n=1 Tax=Solea senegalensis TaxID=28829 RepID=A0AAV6S4J7_SOLSE|nr:hypothetical protein JOB18_031168 [Solea senegalensis]
MRDRKRLLWQTAEEQARESGEWVQSHGVFRGGGGQEAGQNSNGGGGTTMEIIEQSHRFVVGGMQALYSPTSTTRSREDGQKSAKVKVL